MRKRNLLNLFREEQGASLVELAFMLPMFLLLTFGAIDFGRAFYLEIEIAGAAHAAAMYGSQNPTDTAGMKTAAQDDAPNVPNLSVGTPTYGTECSDGTSYTANTSTMPTCSSTTAVYRVNVTVSATYSPFIPWPGVPSTTTLSSSASMRSAGS
jgi:Flp pilus assembly protein TadG